MLKLVVEGDELFDEETQTFETINDTVLYLEHSLVSLSKWESEFQKPFLSANNKSHEEIFYYIKCMLLHDLDDENVIYRFSEKNLQKINDYIESPQSATTFGVMPQQKSKGETITAELIYYWLVAFNIPFECETWHLNRLFSLIRICNIKNSPQKKMSRHEISNRNKELNARRKAELGTKG
jgi:hypothetical protein